jgi:hypothetical protein
MGRWRGGRHLLVVYHFTFLFVKNILFLRFYFLGCNTMWAKDRDSMFLLNVGTNPQVHRTLQTRKPTFINILLVSKIRGCLQWLHIPRRGFWLFEKCNWGLNPMARHGITVYPYLCRCRPCTEPTFSCG